MNTGQTQGGGAGRPITQNDIPKSRTFVVRVPYGRKGEFWTPGTDPIEVAISAHMVEYDAGCVFFKTIRLMDDEPVIVIERAFAAGQWLEFAEFVPSGLIQ